MISDGLNALADACAKQGRYSDAENFYDRVLASTNHGLGPEHDQVVRGLSGLDFVRWKLGQPAHVLAEFALFRAERGYHADARALLERALIIDEQA